jgi:choline dehydrogenase-like flavoprotein
MATTLLPRAESQGAEIRADCSVDRITMEGDRAVEVHAGALRVQADTVILAAGAPGSSLLLRASRLGGRAAGEGISFNLGATLFADFDDELNAHLAQRTVYELPSGTPERAALELWLGLLASEALRMPGWVEHQAYNMRRFSHLVACTVSIGGAATGVLDRRTGRVRYDVQPRDLHRLAVALARTARLMLDAGARRVIPLTQRYREYSDPSSTEELLTAVRRPEDLSLTGYIQGGNPIGSVVGSDLRVRGAKNVYVCDASIFRTSITVPPQLTVMALVDHAVDAMLA